MSKRMGERTGGYSRPRDHIRAGILPGPTLLSYFIEGGALVENTIDKLTLIAYSASKLFNPTTILLEHALLAQGFMGVQKATFPCCLQPQSRDFTCANLVEALK
jgi:hypothetical protein